MPLLCNTRPSLASCEGSVRSSARLPFRSMNVLETCIARIRGRRLRIVFPEAADERIVAAAKRLRDDGLAEPILLENPESSGRLDAYAELYLRGRPDTS